ncbi:MAG: hypothetical protein J5997_09020 [Oscillospiraceae bacterium]|nr:hypothetical protein [Oscillospiraceae bacterium]
MKGDFLDPSIEHKLTEMECELITMYRVLNPTEQKAYFKMLFDLIAAKVKKKEK